MNKLKGLWRVWRYLYSVEDIYVCPDEFGNHCTHCEVMGASALEAEIDRDRADFNQSK